MKQKKKRTWGCCGVSCERSVTLGHVCGCKGWRLVTFVAAMAGGWSPRGLNKIHNPIADDTPTALKFTYLQFDQKYPITFQKINFYY